MDTRPIIPEYKSSFATNLLYLFAGVDFVVGFTVLIFGLISENGGFAIGVGIGVLIAATLHFSIARIIDDIHHKDYLQLYYGEEAYNFHMQALQKLQSIEAMLSQQYYPQYYPDMSGTNTSESQDDQPQPCSPTETFQKQYQAQEEVRKAKTGMEKRKIDILDDDPADFGAQI